MSVAAVVLAAGGSRRMGTSKALLPWPVGETVLGAVLGALNEASVGPAVVVTGPDRAAVEEVARAWGAGCAHNPGWERGEMLSSLQAGLRAAPPASDAALVVLADQPGIPAAVHRAVVAAGRAAGLRGHIVRPELAGRQGHPVLFGRDHVAALLALGMGGRPRDVVDAARDSLVRLELDDPAIVEDLDTPEDYDRAFRRAMRRAR